MPGAPTTHVTLFRGDEIVAQPPEALADLRGRDGAVLWIDLTDPTAETIAPVAQVFHLHPLAVEDALQRQQRPKAEEYGDFLFITTHAARVRPGPPLEVDLNEIDVFLGRSFVITAHAGGVAAIDVIARRLRQAPHDLRCSAGYILYTVLDAVVDTYFPVFDVLDDHVEELIDDLFAHPESSTMDRLFAAKRGLLNLRRVAAPQRDLMNLMLRHDARIVDEPLRAYFRDIYDHLIRITEEVDTHRDLVAGALEIYLTQVSNRLNEVVKVLTVITAIFALLTVVSGIYGMNFERSFPSFDSRYGFVAVLGFMAASVALMLGIFRRLRWL